MPEAEYNKQNQTVAVVKPNTVVKPTLIAKDTIKN